MAQIEKNVLEFPVMECNDGKTQCRCCQIKVVSNINLFTVAFIKKI